jgi:hypothetical protein
MLVAVAAVSSTVAFAAPASLNDEEAAALGLPIDTDNELWAFGYSVPAGNRSPVTTVPDEAAANGFNGNGWGSACINFVGCGR